MGKQARARRERAAQRGDVVQLFYRVAPAVFANYFAEDGRFCVNGTRVAIDVLGHYGIRAHPMVVDVMVFNAIMWRRFGEYAAAHGGANPPPAVVDGWVANDGAWSMGIGAGAAPLGDNDWPKHLVAVASGSVLIDSAAGQFNRPARDIAMPPVLVWNVPPSFVSGSMPAIRQNTKGAVVVYRAQPDDRSYESVPGFQRHAGNAEVTQAVIKLMDILIRGDR